jgi:hypothetical protein
MIGPGGLLLVLPQLLAGPGFSFIGGVAKKSKKVNLDVKNIFAWLHTEHHWGCS